MNEITVLSGKGGTGKTSVTAAIASVANNAILCDNDVDAADLHLLFQPKVNETNTFFSGWNVTIDKNRCTACGLCKELCRFDAVTINSEKSYCINTYACEGCRLCERACPSEAISSERNSNNYWYISSTRFGTLVHAQMGAGEENSGKLVSEIRKKAQDLAIQNGNKYIINDGPPGIGCATIASLTGTNKVLLVIEPTKSGLHDAKRLVELIESFGTKTYAVVNKHDINTEVAEEITQYLNSKSIPLLAKLPFDEAMVESMIEGKTIVEYSPDSEISELIKGVWEKMKS